jgi:hypothetical protein
MGLGILRKIMYCLRYDKVDLNPFASQVQFYGRVSADVRQETLCRYLVLGCLTLKTRAVSDIQKVTQRDREISQATGI